MSWVGKLVDLVDRRGEDGKAGLVGGRWLPGADGMREGKEEGKGMRRGGRFNAGWWWWGDWLINERDRQKHNSQKRLV